MRKLIPVLLLVCSGATVNAQTSSGNGGADSREDSFAESLRLEVIGEIQKKLEEDPALRKSNAQMGDLLKARGINPALTIHQDIKAKPVASYSSLCEKLALVLADPRKAMLIAGVQAAASPTETSGTH